MCVSVCVNRFLFASNMRYANNARTRCGRFANYVSIQKAYSFFLSSSAVSNKSTGKLFSMRLIQSENVQISSSLNKSWTVANLVRRYCCGNMKSESKLNQNEFR